MNIQSKKKEEKVRDVDFTNPTINRIVHYTNLLNEKNDFFKDNGITDFSQIESCKEIKLTNSYNSEIFL